MIPRRGFLAVLGGALGLSFLPKARGEKKFVLPHRPPPVETSGSTAVMAHVTAGSKIVVGDKPIDFLPGYYVAGRGIPVGAQAWLFPSRATFILDREATESCYTLVSADPDPGSAIANLRMEEAGQAAREMWTRALWNEKLF